MGQCLVCLRKVTDDKDGDKPGSKYTALKETDQEELEEELDESIKQRRFTYSEKRKEIVSNEAPRTASVSSVNKARPDVPTKPSKRVSVDLPSEAESDRVALVQPATDSITSDTDTTSVKSEKGKLLKDKPVVDAKPVLKEKPIIKEKPVISEKPVSPQEVREKPLVADKAEEEPEEVTVDITDVKPAVEEETATAEKGEVEKEEDTEDAPEEESAEDEDKEVTEEDETVVEESVEEEDKEQEADKEGVPDDDDDDDEKENTADDPKPQEDMVSEKLTNGVTSPAASMDFNAIEDTAALTSITKSRVRGPKKKSRPTKSCAITTLDPFEVASASERTDVNGAPEPPTPEPEIKPKPKKVYGKVMMPGMGAMNSELMSKLGGKKPPPEKTHESPPDEADKPAADSPATSEETTPKKSPYRPPGAKAMPGMGFGMGGVMGSELAGKLKSRNKASEEPEKAPESEDKIASPTKSKSKGFFSKIDASRPRSPGSLGSRKNSEKAEKPESRSKTWGSSKKS